MKTRRPSRPKTKEESRPRTKQVNVAEPRDRSVIVAKPRLAKPGDRPVAVARPGFAKPGDRTGTARPPAGRSVQIAKPVNGQVTIAKPRGSGVAVATSKPRVGSSVDWPRPKTNAIGTRTRKPAVTPVGKPLGRPTAEKPSTGRMGKAVAKQTTDQRKLKTLDRVLSKAGLGSRTEARSWIGSGRVSVNGKLIQTPDHWVDLDRDKVSLDGKPLQTVQSRYVLLYKPKGYLTTYKDPEGRPTVYDLIPGVDQFLGTVGRLDLDTSGLLLLTNDTQLAERMTNPEHELRKTYLVKAATLLTDEQLQQLAGGIELTDGVTRPAQVQRQRDSGKYTFLEITLAEGRNRQIRRMLEAVASKVLKLVRVKLGPLTLAGLQMGGWRDLTTDEVAELKRLAKRKS